MFTCVRSSEQRSLPEGRLTSVGSDVLDVPLGVFDLDGRPWDQFLAPAAHVVVEVDYAEVVVDGQVVQDGLHGLHGLWGKEEGGVVPRSGHRGAVFHSDRSRGRPELTCFILTPHMEPLTSMTNTMFLRRGERLDGAKNWTKCPSETWRRHGSLEGYPAPTICWTCEVIPIDGYLELPSIALSLHVVLDSKNAIDDGFCAVFTLFLLLEGRFEGDMSLWTQRQRQHNRLTPWQSVNSQFSSLQLCFLVSPCVWSA